MTRLSLLLACGAALVALGQATPAPAAAAVSNDFVTAAPAEPFAGALADAEQRITAAALAAHVAFLASPSLAGRGLGDRGLEAAAEYVAATLDLAGVAAPKPGGRFQVVPMREISQVTGGVTVTRRDGGATTSRAFAHGVDVLLPATAPGTVTADVVFAGYGIREPALARDDLRNLDVRGRILLVVGGLPPGPEWRTEELAQRYDAADLDERYTTRLELARSLGAVAVLAVEPDGWPGLAAAAAAGEAPAFLPLAGVAPDDLPPLVRVSTAVAAALLGAAGSLETATPGPLPQVSASLEVRAEERLLTSRNVLGVIPGSDDGLRGEVVILGAHLDHLGRVGGVAHPGADDNASGVAAALEIARAIAAAPARPKRTIAIAFWTGEEERKLGSGHFVRHPVWPLTRTIYLNLDMIGHPWLAEEIRTLVKNAGLADGESFLAGFDPANFVEPGIPPNAPELEAALRRAAHGAGLTLHFDRTDGTHGGSDYRDFARAGVPFVRFFGNYFPAYHEPGDTADSLDAAQVRRVACLALATAWLLADR